MEHRPARGVPAVRRGVRVVAALLVAALATLGLVATAPTAQAYPEDSCVVSVTPQRVAPGGTVTVEGQAVGSRTWTITWGDQVEKAEGASFRVSLTAPDQPGETTLRVQSSATADLAGCDQRFGVSVVDQQAQGGPTEGGLLPNTGGFKLAVLLLAVALVAAGAYLVHRHRRSAHARN